MSGKHRNLTELSRARELMPPVSPIDAIRKNLLHAMLGAVSVDDMSQIVGAQRDKAKEGDRRAAEFVTGLVLRAGACETVDRSVNVQQAVVVHENKPADVLLDIRKQLVHLIRHHGPMKMDRLGEFTSLPAVVLAKAIDFARWFEPDADGFHITGTARTEVIDTVHAHAVRTLQLAEE